jgi:hypothetical protein
MAALIALNIEGNLELAGRYYEDFLKVKQLSSPDLFSGRKYSEYRIGFSRAGL